MSTRVAAARGGLLTSAVVMRTTRGAAALTVLASATMMMSCASAPRAAVAGAVERGALGEAIEAYERMRASDGPDVALLSRVAALLLEQEARGDDREHRRAAVQELSSAGTAGEPILRRIAASAGTAARVLALEALARRGDEGAQLELRALADSTDADERAASVLGMDIEDDSALLMEAIASPHPRAREYAAERLARAAPETDVRIALENAARVDPEPSVRSAAVRALGAFGAPALTAISERLSDPVAGVRMSAVEALLRADRDQARTILGALLEMPTSAQGIEAARLLSIPGRGDGSVADPGARAFLRQALSASDPSLRSQAGVALVSIAGSGDLVAVLRDALGRETDSGVALSLGRALLRQPGAEQDAIEALRTVMRAGATMTSLQAAAILAGERDGEALGVLAGFLAMPEPTLRRVAARALARDAMHPDDARSALRDHDATVRISAAGGILAAAAASSG